MIGKLPKTCDSHVCELVLLGLDNEWKPRFIAQQFMIELCDQGACRPIPELEVSGNETLSDELVD
jgi:hypothetical protein